MKKITLSIIVSVFTIALVHAQAKIRAELKTEQQSLLAEHNAAAYKERQKEISMLTTPQPTGIGDVDALVVNSNTALALTQKNNDVLLDLCNRTADSTGSLQKPSKEELYAVSNNIADVSNSLAKNAKDLLVLQDDADNADMLKQANVVQSISYVKTVDALLRDELAYQVRLFNNLMATYKSGQ